MKEVNLRKDITPEVLVEIVLRYAKESEFLEGK